MIIDCHGTTRPPQGVEAWRNRQVAGTHPAQAPKVAELRSATTSFAIE
jgi:hypothetical protein